MSPPKLARLLHEGLVGRAWLHPFCRSLEYEEPQKLEELNQSVWVPLLRYHDSGEGVGEPLAQRTGAAPSTA